MMKRYGKASLDEQQAFLDYGDRAIDSDTTPPITDLESTFMRVQRAMRSATNPAASQSMPDHLRMRTWEDIMQNAAAPAMRPGTGRRTTPTHRRSTPLFRMGWTGMANAALALLVVIAGFGAWRVFDGGIGGGGNGPAPSEGRYAQAPMTPVPMATTETEPVVEPIPACDVSRDIPIVKDLAEDASPISGTSLYTVRYDPNGPRSDLMIGCDGEESTLLASNVIDVAPGPWQGTVFVVTLPENTDDLADQQTGYVNFITGKSVTFGPAALEMQTIGSVTDGSPWVFGVAVDNPGQQIVTDLRTMESRQLNDLAGGSLPHNAMMLTSSAANDGTIALGFAHPYSANAEGGTLQEDTGLPGDLMILGTSFDDVSWINLPESLTGIQSMTLSPDGTHAAVVSMSSEGDVVRDSYSYAIIDLSDGALVGQSEPIPYMDNPFVIWVKDGTAVAYTAGNTLQTLSVDGDGQPETVFDAEQQLMTLNTTRDENIVTVTMRKDHGSDADPNSTDIDMVYSVDLETGESLEFAGMDASASVGWITDAGALVMYDWVDGKPDTATYRAFDPVSGEELGTIQNAPSVQPLPRTLPTIGPNSISISDDGTVEVIALGTQHIYAFIADDNGMEMHRIRTPEGLLSEVFLTGNVYLSANGSMLALNGEEDEGRVHYLITLDDPDAAWLAYTPETVGERGRSLISFAEGIE